jgi:hypothetical protein
MRVFAVATGLLEESPQETDLSASFVFRAQRVVSDDSVPAHP